MTDVLCHSMSKAHSIDVDKFAPYLHDAVLLYAHALNKTITKGMDSRSGADVAANFPNIIFSGKRETKQM